MTDTTKIEALEALLVKVQAGGSPSQADWHDVFPDAPNDDGCPRSMMAVNAMGGSLDAAKALHEAVLPGWGWRIDSAYGRHTAEKYWFKTFWVTSPASSRTGQTAPVEGRSEARAWLVAIIKALIWEAKQ